MCGESSEAVHVREMFIYLMVLITAEMKVFFKNVQLLWGLNKTSFDRPTIIVSFYDCSLLTYNARHITVNRVTCNDK